MKLDLFRQKNDFFKASKTLFGDLHIPVNIIDEKTIAPEEILTKTYKDNNEAFQIMDDVIAFGMVDDAAFSDNMSESLDNVKKAKKDYDGILLFGVTLKKRSNGLLPTRTQLAEITRAFNREYYYTPVVVVFRYDNYISLANVERQKYKQEWREGEKAGKVSLLRDIDVKRPHTGHLKILQELTIVCSGRNAVTNFKELYKYWQEVFSVSILNKQFYKELSDWYFWAMREVYFPDAPFQANFGADGLLDPEVREHNAKNLIRLLTRILFVWFIKEKKLIPEEFFDEDYIKTELLKNFEPQKNSSHNYKTRGSMYYRAILQNLFFATLNQDMGKREFRKSGQHMNVTNLMRYKSYFKNPETFIKQVENVVPFMNGGLFECLDKPMEGVKGKRGGDVIQYIDGFSDRDDNPLMVPDYVFFGTEDHINLSDEYGQGKSKNKDVSVKGLIDILQSYKFTIAESTPIEEDIALDPELLGRVFENLLASYNPETKTTARKQTGSFYTPREIVNYMVDESLIVHLKNRLSNLVKDEKTLDDKLHQLLSYDDIQPFEDEETKEAILKAIDECKILDPACGSGAFPMGALQKMVHIIHKLDPQNERWKERQIEKAHVIDDSNIRDSLIDDIEEAFENNELDFGRKLYLIENCIYGIDIQPIAVQISKLRFFISLIVEQKVNKRKKNHGVRPLPNLETKFVAANTLIGLDKPEAHGNLVDSQDVNKLKDKLKNVRHRLFSAKTPKTKRKLREEDKELREQIAQKLEESGWGNETAHQLADWDPYDQNGESPFFDPEWMFDVKDGFDIVIGNPPYFNINNIEKNFVKYLSTQYDIIHTGYNDIVYYFIFLGIKMLRKTGCSVLITSNYFLGNEYAQKLRQNLGKHISKIVNFKEYMVFDAASVHTCISISYNTPKHDDVFFFEAVCDKLISSSDIEKELNSFSIKRHKLNETWLIADQKNIPIFNSLKNKSVFLGDISTIEKGPTSGKNKVFTIPRVLADEMKLEKTILRKNVKNGDIDKYTLRDRGNYLIYIDNNTLIESYPKAFSYLKVHKEILANRNEVKKGSYSWYRFERPRRKQVFDAKEKIVVPYRAIMNRFAYDNQQHFNDGGDIRAIVINEDEFNIKYVLAILNSKLIDWYYGFIGKPKGKTREYFNRPLSLIPIKKIPTLEQEPLINLVDIIINDKNNNSRIHELCEHLIDAMVFELYFPDHMKERKIDVLKFIEKDIEEAMQGKRFETLNNTQKEQAITELHNRWSDPDSEIVKRMNSFSEKSPEILKPIPESSK